MTRVPLGVVVLVVFALGVAAAIIAIGACERSAWCPLETWRAE